VNLNAIFAIQSALKQQGSMIVDEAKMYNTLDRLTAEVGLKDAALYFNNPEQPQQMLQAQVEQLSVQLHAMQQQMQNPLAEVEQIRAQAKLTDTQQKQQFEMQKMMLEMQQKQQQFEQNYLAKLTELELKYQQNVPGAIV
jgi:Skp family chaperone for outer membrane proteins